jgi:hypothetical protein
MRNTADVTGGKPIAVLLQSISGVSAINPLVAFYDIHGGKRGVLFFYCPSLPSGSFASEKKHFSSISTRIMKLHEQRFPLIGLMGSNFYFSVKAHAHFQGKDHVSIIFCKKSAEGGLVK